MDFTIVHAVEVRAGFSASARVRSPIVHALKVGAGNLTLFSVRLPVPSAIYIDAFWPAASEGPCKGKKTAEDVPHYL